MTSDSPAEHEVVYHHWWRVPQPGDLPSGHRATGRQVVPSCDTPLVSLGWCHCVLDAGWKNISCTKFMNFFTSVLFCIVTTYPCCAVIKISGLRMSAPSQEGRPSTKVKRSTGRGPTLKGFLSRLNMLGGLLFLNTQEQSNVTWNQ